MLLLMLMIPRVSSPRAVSRNTPRGRVARALALPPAPQYVCALLCVEGIVTKASLVQPKIVKSVHYCPATQLFENREYRDATAIDLGKPMGKDGGRVRVPTGSSYPTQDENGNPLETEYGLSTYKDHQCVTIQEMPERAPLGQLPRSVEVGGSRLPHTHRHHDSPRRAREALACSFSQQTKR